MANEPEKGKTMNKVVSEETQRTPELFVETYPFNGCQLLQSMNLLQISHDFGPREGNKLN